MNGVGGGISQSSKTAIISPSNHPDYDVEYFFGQVSIDRPLIEYTGNCGNLSAAVGPFAVDEGLVKAVEPVTRVRIFQKNTNKRIIAEVPVRDGCFNEEGDYSISGIPGAGSKITLRFADPGGSMTGKLLPTGHVQDFLTIPDLGTIPISIVDAANPVVFVQASRIGLSGKEIDKMDTPAIREKLEAIRSHAPVLAGLAESPEDGRKKQTVPKMAVVSPPKSYHAVNRTPVDRTAIDLTVRMMSMGRLHRSYAVTGAICTVGTAMIPGTVVHEVARSKGADRPSMLLGHPGGAIEGGAVLEKGVDGYLYQEAVVGRTARRLMDGYVRVPKW